MATAAEAGWYDDGTGRHRWWDGARWTDQYIDLREHSVELRTDAAPASAPATAGWYDDGRGRHRWWDGRRWTDAARFSGTEDTFAGIVIDGRWIHFGSQSQPSVGARAEHTSGGELLRRGRLGEPAIARVLHGPSGLITPRLLARSVDTATGYLIVDVAGQVWLAPVPIGHDAQARQFAAWIVSVSEHYRYR